MAKHLKYYGEFISVENHSIRVAIYQDSDTPFVPKEIFFPADSPLVIEWGEVEKHDVLCGSSATLRICATPDLQFDDLYSVEYGTVRLDVWRDGEFYWTGCIDTETFEKDWETWNGEVSLTFFDFGILDRLKFDVEIGFNEIKNILTMAVMKTQCVRTSLESDFDDSFEYSTWVKQIDWSKMMLSTTYVDTINAGGMPIGIIREIVKNAYVRTDNFYDEDGKAKTWKEVVEGILRPLNVRITQKGGMMFLYDLHSLYNYAEAKEIYWSADAQTYSIDKVYNNIHIAWSPYAQSSNMLPSECWPENIKTNREVNALDQLDGISVDNATVFSYPLSQLEIMRPEDEASVGFSMWTTSECKGITLADGYKVFKIVPQYDGDSCEGVVVFHRSFRYGGNLQAVHGYDSKTFGSNPVGSNYASLFPTKTLFESEHVTIPPQSTECPLQLRLKMDMLMDVRVNPFENPFGFWHYENKKIWTCQGAMEYLNTRANIVYIPVRLHFKPTGSNKDYCYTNTDVLSSVTSVVEKKQTEGEWKEKASGTYCWLAYYNADPKGRAESTAVCKWVANRQAINPHGRMLTVLMEKMDDGQFIVYPEIGVGGGEMWIEVMADGWVMTTTDGFQYGAAEGLLSFAMVKLPELEIVNDNVFDQELQLDDVVYDAEVNKNAKEELSLDTIMGSYVEGVPTARGCYYKSNGSPIRSVSRNGKTGMIEELLCGTLYSQYAERHVCLTGECRVDTERNLLYTEANSEGKKFICISESQNVITDTAEVQIVELSDDEYEKNEEI